MARYYTTADRQFTDDYIYKPPIEIANQMIDRAQGNVDKVNSEANADLVKIYDQIPYYRDTDEQDYRNLVNTIENEYNSVMNLAKENPFKDYSAQIAQAKANVARMMQQGGQYWNVTENARRYDNQVRMAKSVIKDQNLLNKTLEYIKDEYRQGRTNEYDEIVPLTQDNLFGTEPSFAYSQGMDPEAVFASGVKAIKPDQIVNGVLTTQKVTKDDIEKYKESLRKAIESGNSPTWKTYMEHADRVGMNGDEKWLVDGKVNTNGSLWKNLGVTTMEQYAYSKQTKRSSGSGSGSGSGGGHTNTIKVDIPNDLSRFDDNTEAKAIGSIPGTKEDIAKNLNSQNKIWIKPLGADKNEYNPTLMSYLNSKYNIAVIYEQMGIDRNEAGNTNPTYTITWHSYKQNNGEVLGIGKLTITTKYKADSKYVQSKTYTKQFDIVTTYKGHIGK